MSITYIAKSAWMIIAFGFNTQSKDVGMEQLEIVQHN
jgi:hypothetical protein